MCGTFGSAEMSCKPQWLEVFCTKQDKADDPCCGVT